MSTKCMACQPPQGEHMPFEAFKEAKKTFYFVTAGSENVCYVAPYVIVVDGSDILTRFATPEKRQIDIGWKFPVFYKRKVHDFDVLIEEGIKEKFLGLWESVKTMTHKPIGIDYKRDQGIVRKPGVKYTDLTHSNIAVHATNRGCYSLNRKRFHPIYFLVVPNAQPVNFIPSDTDPDNKPAVPINFRTLAMDHTDVILTYTARKIMEMIQSGEVVLPVINGDPEWSE